MKLKEVTRLLAVLIVGFIVGSGLTPLHAENLVPAGEILNVCINKKTGALRVANKCTSAERKTVLGGVGARGEKGDKGETGATGLTGATGAVGPQGAQGPAGTNGVNGAQGERGLTGATGATGSQGPQGIAGATGATGPSGVSGLRTVKIDFLTGYYYNWCNGTGRSLSIGSTTLPACSVTVYVP